MVRFWLDRTLYLYNLNRLQRLKGNQLVHRLDRLYTITSTLNLSKEMHNKDINVTINTYMKDYYNLKEYLQTLITYIDSREYITPDKFIGYDSKLSLYRFFQRGDKAIKIPYAIEELSTLIQRLKRVIVDASLSNIALMEYYNRILPSLLTEIEKLITLIGDYRWHVKRVPTNR